MNNLTAPTNTNRARDGLNKRRIFNNRFALLAACSFKYYEFMGMEAAIHVCTECMPVEEITNKFDLTAQCGEDTQIYCTVWVDTDYIKNHKTGQWENPICIHQGICGVCNKEAETYLLRVELNNINHT